MRLRHANYLHNPLRERHEEWKEKNKTRREIWY